LDHAGRTSGAKIAFSRKLASRSIGDNTRKDVEAYIERQVPKEQFIDSRFASAMAQFTISDDKISLSQPTATASGQYWYNLHLVLVAEDRLKASDLDFLTQIRDATLRIAAKKSHAISRLAVMPDHLHLALRPSVEESPFDVVFAYQNNLAHLLGRIWKDSYYVGTFGDFTTQAAVSAGASQ
jgi:REP element-mobilizing transposase RayT